MMKRRRLDKVLPKGEKFPKFVEVMERKNHAAGVLKIFNAP